MIGYLNHNKSSLCVYLFYSCQKCGDPLVTVENGKTIDRRQIGICADCDQKSDFDPNTFDPYGQPIMAEVTA